jgi:cyclic pyranopterin phosphate synthase
MAGMPLLGMKWTVTRNETGKESDMPRLNHFDETGNAVMVDVSGKDATVRTAIATGAIRVSGEIMDQVLHQKVQKGDVLAVARVAGIMAAKQTSSLIPMCHPLGIRKCSIDFETDQEQLEIRVFAAVKVEEKTGVEMEALTAATVALLTIYDMCKSIDKRMEITNVHLVEKTGGKSGEFRYD